MRALDFDPATGYRETHASACTRVGLLPTPPRAPLSGAVPTSTARGASSPWDAASISAVLSQLSGGGGGSFALATPLVAGCCAPALWCARAGGGFSCFTHSPPGQSFAYENFGWLLDDGAVPVYSCQALPLDAGALAARAGAAPYVASAAPAPGRPAGVVRLDGARLGASPSALTVAVGGAPCAAPAVCHTTCEPCTSSAQCAEDKVCLLKRRGAPGQGVCLAPCGGGGACACGGQCYPLADASSGYAISLCANPGVSTATADAFYAGLCAASSAGLWAPPPASGLPHRVECTLGGQPWSPIMGGQRRRVMGAGGGGDGGEVWDDGEDVEEAGSAGGGLPRFAALAEEGARARAAAGGAGAAAAEAEWAAGMAHVRGALRLAGAGGHVARLARGASTAPVAALADGGGGAPARRRRRATAPPAGGYMALMPGPPAGGARYSAAASCAGFSAGGAMPHGAAPVVLTRGGAASSGFSASFAAAAGVLNATAAGLAGGAYGAPTAPPALVAAAAALGALGYTGRLPIFNGTGFQCRVGADCPVLDACSAPSCRIDGLVNASSGGGAAGCCVYAARGGGACASPAVALAPGVAPAPFAYVPLPASAAAALPLPPPPKGGAFGNYVGAGAFVNPSLRDPATAPNLNVWDARSVWWAPASAGMNTSFPSGEPYVFQSSSAVDDAPFDSVSMPPGAPPVSSWGAAARTWYTSSNGFVRSFNVPPCNGTFGSAVCGFLDDYAGVVAPLVADFHPGLYVDSEIWGGGWDASPLSAALAGGLLPSARNPAAALLCVAFVNMGLYFDAAPNPEPPPNPSFSFLLCLHGDGAQRWRYGRLLGAPGEVVGRWVPASTLLPPPAFNVSGALPGAAWLAGTRASLLEGATDGASALAAAAAPLPPPGAPPQPDVAALSPKQLLLGRPGVRPGATAGACATNPMACASPVCGGAGTVVRVSWAGLGCGLGLEALGPLGGAPLAAAARGGGGPPPRASGAAPALLCAFGSQLAPATWASYNATTGLGVLECAAPPQDPTAPPAVPLTLRAVLPASAAGYAGGGVNVVTGGLGAPAPLGAALGVEAPEGGVLSSSGAEVTLPLTALHGLQVQSYARAAADGGGNVTSLVAVGFFFTYGGGACGCSAADPAATCSATNVCGGVDAGLPKDCAGTLLGPAFIDRCGRCSGGASGHAPDSDVDCKGVCFGRDFSCWRTTPAGGGGGVEPSWTEGTVAYVLVALLIVVASIFCFAFCQRMRYAREDDRAMVEMLMGDPEALGLPPGLSPPQLARMTVWTWAGPEEATAKTVAGGIETCNVCMEDLAMGDAMRLLSCKHAFHLPCIDTWLARSTLCPICRAELRTPEEVAADRAERFARAQQMAGGHVQFADLRLPPVAGAVFAPPPAGAAAAPAAPPAAPLPPPPPQRPPGPPPVARGGRDGRAWGLLGPIARPPGPRPNRPLSATPPVIEMTVLGGDGGGGAGGGGGGGGGGPASVTRPPSRPGFFGGRGSSPASILPVFDLGRTGEVVLGSNALLGGWPPSTTAPGAVAAGGARRNSQRGAEP